MSSGASISVKDITKRFGDHEAVSGVTLDVGAGEFVAIMGSSGSGKTTLLRMIAGLDVPSSGTIAMDGVDVTEARPWERDTPLVWQNFALFPHMTVRENVEYGLRMRRVPRMERSLKSTEALATVGLAGYGDRHVNTLSGGQRQRVGLARAIVLRSRVLLLDEPMGALDMTTAHALQRELKRLHRELRMTFVYVTHNQNEAFSLADKVAIMSQGKIQQIGSARDISTRPQNEFVARFIGLPNILTGTVVELRENEAVVETALGPLPARAVPGHVLQAGGKLVVFPDQIVVSRKAARPGSEIAGRVVRTEAIGLLIAIAIRTDNDTEIVAHLPAFEFDRLDISVDKSCVVSWPREAAWLLPE